ncbi:FHA domain-containing protein [Nocardioides flavescens]|uniref:FHA domain-containing protein n=1 Tax=Nocardioides flavescens TaxID=2691959 RepID=A0A6L7EZL3_9ACTN|nr:FHA domain-containing protein [Nocardioides flavescens]MXG89102.1 hypothetical protein [Nocardioides flavescens]
MTTVVGADLEFTLSREGHEDVRGRIRGRNNRLVLEVDDAGAFAGGADAPAIKAVAEGLARRGMTLEVVQSDRHLVTLGAVRAPWWQKRVTGTRRIKLGSLRGALTSARSRTRAQGPALPTAGLIPPPVVLPELPLFRRRLARTTHDPDRGGAARLVVVKEAYLPGEAETVFWLRDGMTIGSGPDCDVRLPGLADQHAVVEHDDDDEWVIRAVRGLTRVHGAPVVRQAMRTGARITLGSHELAYYREEYADHGRPFGGRIGGELGRQATQPPRESGPAAG